jgi:GDP-4-dehydro-6-deoxy-D-mannose reductase
VTKAAQNLLGVVYAKAYRIPIILVRAFNHIGPGQEDHFVVSDFSKQIAMIEKGLCPPVLHVGNLSAKRDFCDVRDIVKAYALLLQSGIPGETYNVGSGRAVAIQEILHRLLRFTGSEITFQVEPKRYRPVDIPCMQADVRKLSAVCGWKPRYSLDRSLQDMLNYWRTRT